MLLTHIKYFCTLSTKHKICIVLLCLLIWEKQKGKRERKRERESADSLIKCSQQLELGQVKTRSWESNTGLLHARLGSELVEQSLLPPTMLIRSQNEIESKI